jgi:hypothetical protein
MAERASDGRAAIGIHMESAHGRRPASESEKLHQKVKERKTA